MEEAAPRSFSTATLSDFTNEARHGELTDFPVRDSPSVGHPVGDIRAPGPSTPWRRDRVEIGIGGTLCSGKAALLLTNLEAEPGEASLEAGHVTSFDRLDVRRGWRAILLVVRQSLIFWWHAGRWVIRYGRVNADELCCRREGKIGKEDLTCAYIEELRLMDKIKKMGQISYGLHNTVLYRGSRKKKRKRSKAVQYAIG
jgi:hypothetical protein